MAFTLPPEVARLIEGQTAALAALKPAGKAKLLAIAKDVQVTMERRLRSISAERFAAQETRVVLAQVRAVVDSLAAELGDRTGRAAEDIARAAAGVGRESLALQIEHWAREFEGSVRRIAPVELSGDLLGDGLLEYYRSSRERYGLDALARMRRAMATGSLSGETLLQTSERLSVALDLKPYWAERIVRTEASFAMHRRQLEDLRRHEIETGEAWEKMTTGPMDRRTGMDSRAIEGQRRPLDEAFDNPEFGPFMHNPDRPMDRGTTVFVPRIAT